MYIITLRTDNPEAEVGLYKDDRQLAYERWTAHRQLAVTVHSKIKDLLDAHTLNIHEVTGIVIFKGPGSFTGLRIGITVANALAYSLPAQVVGASGDHWIHEGIRRLLDGTTDSTVSPEYGAAPHITAPRK